MIKCCRLLPAHLHLHHFVFALRAEGPLVGEGIVVVGALAAVQTDGVPGQLDDLDGATKKPSSVTSVTGRRSTFYSCRLQLILKILSPSCSCSD